MRNRIFALLIDYIFISIFISIFSSFFEKDFWIIDEYLVFGRKWFLVWNLWFGFTFIYFVFFDFAAKGLSLGKKIMNLRVVDEANLTPKIQVLILRTFLKSLFLLNVFFLGVVIYYFVKDEVLYDKIARTKVI